MLNLLRLNTNINTPISIDPSWRMVKANIRKNLGRIVQYYRINPGAVKSDHLLASMLINLGVPIKQPLERFYDNTDTVTSRTILSSKLTSSIAYGKIHRGVFYGPNVDEIIIGYSGDFDPFEADRNWENLCPVKVIMHPVSNLECLPLNGKLNNTEEGMAIISINIPMLAIQYRAFRLREMQISQHNEESPLGLYHFIKMYVLPNMLFSHFDYALFNRAYNLLFGAPMGAGLTKHPFGTLKLTKDVDDILTRTNERMLKSNRSIVSILKNYPLAYERDFLELTDFPDIAPTSQVYWAMVISQLNMIEFVTKLSQVGLAGTNGGELNKMRQIVRQIKNNNKMKSMIESLDSGHLIMGQFEDIENMLKA